MNRRLRAIVVGAGWAGEGHTLALRHLDVDVVAICARQPEVARSVADRLGVRESSTDWRGALFHHRPDVVSVATPASLRSEVIEAACEIGCHVMCEKPLATTGEEAGRLYRLAQSAGIKHAYGATQRYDPSVVWLADLVTSGAIGAVREIVVTHRSAFPALTPWSWMFTLAGGGGLLNNVGTHLMAVLARICSGELVAVSGHARVVRTSAPVVPDLHDFRAYVSKSRELTAEVASTLEWRDCDADDTYSALLRYASPKGDVIAAITTGPGPHPPGETNRMRIYGDDGLLVADGGGFAYTVARVQPAVPQGEPLAVPQRLVSQLPRVGDPHQDKWGALLRDFLADIQRLSHPPYPTFRDGWRSQVAVDAVRRGAGWVVLPS